MDIEPHADGVCAAVCGDLIAFRRDGHVCISHILLSLFMFVVVSVSSPGNMRRRISRPYDRARDAAPSGDAAVHGSVDT